MSQRPAFLARPRQVTSPCGGGVGTRRSKYWPKMSVTVTRCGFLTSSPVDNPLFPRIAFAAFCLLSCRGGDDAGVGVGCVPRLIGVEAVDGRLWAERRFAIENDADMVRHRSSPDLTPGDIRTDDREMVPLTSPQASAGTRR